jgi:hypothetical protein
MLRSPKTWIAATWLVSFCVTLAWLWRLTMLFDSDSYYHLAIAREYARRGLFSELEWARFSVMRHGFGDKELLFHLLLAPFAAGTDPVFGGKLAMACLTATIMATLARIAIEPLGVRGLWVPALLLCGSMSFDLRIIRLRPELLALLLLLWTVHALAFRRYWMVGILAGLFALAYTAVHALLGACVLCFVCALWLDKKPRFRMLLFPLLGAALGLALHPHFPHNLRIFYLQNVLFWRYADHADVGSEIQALGLLRWLRFDWPLLLGVSILALSLDRSASVQQPTAHERESAWFYTMVALAFCAGFIHSGRFALYAVPFSLLALAWQARLHGLRLGSHLRRLGSGAPRSWLVLGLLICIAALLTEAELTHVVDQNGCLWPALRSQLEALGRAMPVGARVAAPWGASEDYVYFAPQGRYLNLLDPIFMRVEHPMAYDTQRRMFDGQLFDVPLALIDGLDSDYIAFNAPSLPRLHRQLLHDPRVVPLIAGGHALYRVEPGRNRSFVLDYRVGDTRESVTNASGRSYPRKRDARARQVEAFIDTGRVAGAHQCRWFAPVSPLTAGATYEFDASAMASVWLGEAQLLRVKEGPSTLMEGHQSLSIGQGRRLQMPAGASVQQLSIEVCSGAVPAVFYLLRLE